jgi:hypothetical protein
MSKIGRLAFAGALVAAPFIGAPAAEAHGGGLDSTGGHYCRQAGYDSGKCAPLNSYHCHQAPCGEAAPATTAKATTTTVRRTTTTSPPPPPTTATTQATTTTMKAATTTTEATTTTTTEATTTTTSTTLVPVAADRGESDDGGAGAVLGGVAVTGALGFGGYRLVRRRRFPVTGR